METRDGQPLSVHRPPSDDLKPWIARLYSTQVEIDPGRVVSCGVISDTPVLRMLFKGKWTAESAEGHKKYSNCALFFGPQSKRMPITVEGDFSVLSLALNPGAMSSFGPFPIAPTVDRIIPYGEFGYNEDGLFRQFADAHTPEEQLAVGEKLFRTYLDLTKAGKPDPLTRAFDMAAFRNPNMKVGDFAEEQNVSPKKVERVVKRDFGLSPKKVLRRARAMDMAANLRGVGDEQEADELALRYFDQSHLNREFQEFFGITPVQFVKTPQPLIVFSLEARQARRLELLGRLDEGGKRPWEK